MSGAAPRELADSVEGAPAPGEPSRLVDRLQMIVESTDQGIFALDERGRCTLFNRAASSITGWPAPEVVGKSLHALIHHTRPDGTPCPPEVCAVLGVLRTGRGVRHENEVCWRRDGTSFPAEYSSYPIFEDGRVVGVVATVADATRRKEDRDGYRATLNMLEDFDEERAKFHKVQQATLNLLEDMNEERDRLGTTQRALMNILEDVEVERRRAEQAKMQLEAVNRELEAFSYSVSHDLRAPLRAVSGFAQAVEEDYAPRLDDEGRRFLGLIQESAHKMGRLIDDLLTFSRLGRRQMVDTQVDIQALAQSVFDELSALTPPSRITFVVDPCPPARGDEALLRQALVNLLSNAMKFTRTRAEPRIEVGYLSDPEPACYYVKDNGVGFDMQYAGKLFGVFQRLHAVTEFEGTGVGLAIVYRIITRHGGRVWARGEVDKGATFYFTLPGGEAR